MILILLNIFIANPVLTLSCWLILAGPNGDVSVPGMTTERRLRPVAVVRFTK